MTTAREIVEQKLKKRITEKTELTKGIGMPVALELTGSGGGTWVLDCSQQPATLSESSKGNVTTTITMDAKVFEDMASGSLNPQMAFLSGKVKVTGNLGVAIKLGQLLT